jgi:hypothetical protein
MPETQAEVYARLLPQLRRAVAKPHPVALPPTWDHTFHFNATGRNDFTALVIRIDADPEGDRLFVSVNIPRFGSDRPANLAADIRKSLAAVRQLLGPVGELVDVTHAGERYATWIFNPSAEWYLNPGPKREEV